MASTDLHFVLFPLMAPGHMIPMVDIARMLAQRGPIVTIITTPLNATRFKPSIARATEANLKIQVLELPLRLAQVGLPEGCESFDTLPSVADALKLYSALEMLEEPAETLLRRLTPAPSCIITDNFFHWTTNTARTFDIPRLVFHGPGCFAFLCIHIVMNTDILDQINSDSDYFPLPGLPDRIEVTKPQASSWVSPDSREQLEIQRKTGEAEKLAFGIVVNSFHELEPKYVEEFAKAKDKKVYCIGPVSLSNKTDLDIAERGEKSAINEHDCLKWLDLRETRSVVYVCLGTLSHASAEQTIELALGLESSNKPFVWCLRHPTEEFDKWFSKEQYGERVSDRGLIVRGWAPQVLILSHRAVGGFLTHCGWNSTLEGICAGLPMVTWPHFADQFLNEKFIVQVLKIGVQIGVEIPILYGEQDKSGVLVKKEDVKMAVERLMDEEVEGDERRTRARELREMAKRAMDERGSSQINLTTMIQDICEELVRKMKLIQDVV